MNPSLDLPSLGRALAGQYVIERELGRGGMGIVLLARDERLDRQVALKVLPPALAEQGDTRERFLREARMAAKLSHPNIVPVHRADDIGGFAFFAMGYVDGETLGERIRDRGTLPAAETVRLLREVAWALAYAHARGIVHRDVKPENILIERSTGRAIVTDFGIARADFHPSLTQDGLVLGTVHYMSPEQASGEPVDGRSDLYALGCVGYFALSGRLPFEDASPHAVLVAHATRQPPLLRDVARGVPPELAAVIDRCLRKRPDERFDNGEALADALGKAADTARADGDEQADATVLSSEDAMAVWRRAAELQAEAAARLETRMRDTQGTRALIAADRAVSPDGGTTPASAGAGAGAAKEPESARVPTDAYRLRDVEAAALEVGISQRYVALALAELQSSSPGAIARAQPMSEWKERFATRVLGTSQRTLSVSRIYRFPPRTVLPVMGRVFTAHPYSLTLRETLGGHPLDGGVLLFGLPPMPASGEGYMWTWTRYGVWVPEIRVTIALVPGDARACEVTIHVDLRRGITANLAGYGVLTGAGTGLGGLGGALLGAKALALAGIAIAGPAMVGAVILGLGAAATIGPLYRWEMGKTSEELARALDAVDAAIRADDIFGDSNPLGRLSR